jgi:hypothetical protein
MLTQKPTSSSSSKKSASAACAACESKPAPHPPSPPGGTTSAAERHISATSSGCTTCGGGAGGGGCGRGCGARGSPRRRLRSAARRSAAARPCARSVPAGAAGPRSARAPPPSPLRWPGAPGEGGRVLYVPALPHQVAAEHGSGLKRKVQECGCLLYQVRPRAPREQIIAAQSGGGKEGCAAFWQGWTLRMCTAPIGGACQAHGRRRAARHQRQHFPLLARQAPPPRGRAAPAAGRPRGAAAPAPSQGLPSVDGGRGGRITANPSARQWRRGGGCPRQPARQRPPLAQRRAIVWG